MKQLKALIFVVCLSFFAFSPFSPLVSSVKAQTTLICEIFPFIENIGAFGVSSICLPNASEVPTTGELVSSTFSTIQFAVSLIFVGIIIVAVYIVIKAAVKYIRSEGDDTKIQEAQKAIKSAFVGLIALFVGIIGLVLILVLFQATGALSNGGNIETIQLQLEREGVNCPGGGVRDAAGFCGI